MDSFILYSSTSFLPQSAQRDRKWRLWSVHNSSLLLLYSHTSPLLLHGVSVATVPSGHMHLLQYGVLHRHLEHLLPSFSDLGAHRIVSHSFTLRTPRSTCGAALWSCLQRHPHLSRGLRRALQWVGWIHLELTVSAQGSPSPSSWRRPTDPTSSAWAPELTTQQVRVPERNKTTELSFPSVSFISLLGFCFRDVYFPCLAAYPHLL